MMSCVTCLFFSNEIAIIIFQDVNPNWPHKIHRKRQMYDVVSYLFFVWGGRRDGCIHPRELTWNLRIQPWKRNIIFQIIIFRSYVNLWGCNWLTSQGFWYKKPWFMTGILGDRSKVLSKNNSSLAFKKVGLAIHVLGYTFGKMYIINPEVPLKLKQKTTLSCLKKNMWHSSTFVSKMSFLYFWKKNMLAILWKKQTTQISIQGENMLTKCSMNKNRRKFPLNPKLPCDDLRIRKGSRSTLLI